ncbi:MAG: LapA family protein [Caldimonas sp.]
MGVFVWLLRAVVFFTLFAFALNNQEAASVRLFFGQEWRAPMVFIVLAAFGLGCAFGIFAMVPSWWRHRRIARTHSRRADDPLPAPVTPTVSTAPLVLHPPRDGL